MTNNNILSVSLVNHYIKEILDAAPGLRNIQVTGEVSNFKRHQAGHWYFTLKDEKSRISAVMFSSAVRNSKTQIKDGDKVIVTATISVYEVSGSYQLYVTKIEPVGGKGSLYVEFEKLKKKLFEEGLFDDAHKVALPKFPTRICVISAPKGAAVRDIITTIQRRWPLATVTLIPSLVQGDGAKEELTDALKYADTLNFDVIIFGRGGGSIEDLWAFNEEIVARQLYAMKTPVVSAVGHEIDFTISDFVADMRAPTPTAAGELVTPNQKDVFQSFHNYGQRLVTGMSNQLGHDQQQLEHYRQAKVLNYPEELYGMKWMQVDSLKKTLLHTQETLFNNISNKLVNSENTIRQSFQKEVTAAHSNYNVLIGKLNALSPLNVLERGYGIATLNNKVVDSVNKVQVGDSIVLKLRDGSVTSQVTHKEDKNHGK